MELAAFSSPGTSNGSDQRNNNEMLGMLRNTESPTVNLTRVIKWSNYFGNETKSEKTEDDRDNDDDEEDRGIEISVENEIKIETTDNTTDTSRNVRVKSESDGDDDVYDDGKNSTSGFSSNVELTEEVNIMRKLFIENVHLPCYGSYRYGIIQFGCDYYLSFFLQIISHLIHNAMRK